MNETIKVLNIPIEQINPNIYQPRIKFDNKTLENLSKSIQNYGIIQPLTLRKVGTEYEIIDGERRFKVAEKLGLKTVPAIVLEISEKEAAELILTENLQKEILTPIEEAIAYQQIMLLNNFNIDELAKKIGKDKQSIENKLKLLTLPYEIQDGLLNNNISEAHAKLLAKITNKKDQIKLFHRTKKERITVKNLEEIIENEYQNKDVINLKELEKKNKMEEDTMDNSQFNFNQYNNLLKDNKPEMATQTPAAPIIGGTVPEPKPNQFFPSLEEQPANLEIPGNNIEQPSMSMPTFEMPTQPVTEPTVPVTNPVEVPQMEMPQMPAFETHTQPVTGPTVPVTNPVEVPQMEMPQMPTFEMPTQPVTGPTVPVTNPVEVPQMEMPQMPAFETHTQPVTEPTVPVTNPVEVPQMEMPQMPAFETHTQPVTEPVTNSPAPASSLVEALQVNTPVKTDVMPAVNMIRNLIPLLENSGYQIHLAETNNPDEYQVVIKIQK